MLSLDGTFTFIVNGDPNISPGPTPTLNFVEDEVPGGAIDGSNKTFTTAHSYVGLMVFLNGVKQHEGAANDYTETGVDTFDMVDAPLVTDILTVAYFYV